MKLKSITIINFKGIKSLTLNLAGKSADILGDNATGKTSIYDAFLWLLFGKDSRGATNFSIKPIVDGEPLHNVETHVEADLELADGSINLIRKYREVWTRKRGETTDTFSGHETLYYVDSLPVSQAAYKKQIDSIMPEDLFRILTNPFYFPETLKWQERRLGLLRSFGNLSYADVAAADPRFEEILQLAGRYTPEQFLEATKKQIRNYNAELKELPARMDETGRQILEDDDLDLAKAEEERISAEIRALKDALEGEDKTLTAQLAEVQRQILELREMNGIHRTRTQAENAEKNRKAMNAIADQLTALHIPELEATAAIETKAAESLQNEIIQLRAKFAAEASKVFGPVDVCPTCGRPFAQEDIEASRKAFENARKARLDDINAEGRELTARLNQAKEKASEALAALDEKRKIAAQYEDAMDALRKDPLAEDMEGYAEKLDQLNQRRGEILAAIHANSEDRTKEISGQMGAKYPELIEAKERVAACMVSRNARERLAELRDQQAAVVEALEDAEAHVTACEELIRARASMVEESVNRHFRLVKWQLYREQVNGGLEEICEATVAGVPFHDLNGAMRINAGLDIINAHIDATGISAPVFVDNAESVTSLYDVNAQVIRLVVSAKDKQLKLQK